jgi:uncharacterized membrane protein YdjX (TVP38/TMEM64 family)
MTNRWHVAPRVAVLGTLVVLAVVVIRSDALHRAILEAFSAAERVIREHPVGGISVFLLLAALSAVLAFFSSAFIVPIGVFVWGRAATLLLLWIGWTAGGVAGYWLSRTLGRRVVRWLAPDAPVARYEGFVTRARWPLVLLFQLALPSELTSCILGLAGYPFARYLLIVMFAELPFAAMAVYLGDAFLKQQALAFGGTLAAAGALTAIAWRVLRRHTGESAGQRGPTG